MAVEQGAICLTGRRRLPHVDHFDLLELDERVVMREAVAGEDLLDGRARRSSMKVRHAALGSEGCGACRSGSATG